MTFYHITAWVRVLENLVVAQLVNKFLVIYGTTQRLIKIVYKDSPLGPEPAGFMPYSHTPLS